MFAVPVAIANALIAAFLVWLLVDQTRRFVAGRDFGAGVGAVFAYIALVIVVALVLYLVIAFAWTFSRIARTRIWLRGPTLVERRTVLRRRIDLRTAGLELRSFVRDGEPGISLVATDRRSGKSVDFPIRQGGKALPAAEIVAVAQAIRAGRHDDDAAHVTIIVNTLHELAGIDR